MPRYAVINGPHLDRLGRREPDTYGSLTLEELESDLHRYAATLSVEIVTHQSNHEAELLELVTGTEVDCDGIVLNPGALTHYSRALGEAVAAISIPVVEVHISNVLEREPWRRRSVLDPVYRIYGRGTGGYRWALRHLVNRAAVAYERVPYGPLPDQYGDLRAAPGARILAVLIHGGLWRHEWTADTTESLAVDLFGRGVSTFNLEYRRLGLGGGWPESFADVASALWKTPGLTGFSSERVVLVGHSAGATMSLWAEHPGLVVAMAPFCDLVEARSQHLAGDTFDRLLPEPPGDPSLYSPAHRLPRAGEAIIVASASDRMVPIGPIRQYAEAARPSIELAEIEGSHFDFLEPSTTGWGLVVGALEARKATV